MRIYIGVCLSGDHSLMVTVEPDARSSSNVLPAGTVKPLITTVVHLTASETSSREDMVPVHAAPSATSSVVFNGLARTEKERARITEAIASIVSLRSKEEGTNCGLLA